MVTIPRLELCAALLLAQLAKKVVAAMEIHFDEFFCGPIQP
jgi:Pao retrotransposon peptidase